MKGIIDLKNWDSSPLELRGEWRFKWMEDSKDFIRRDYNDSGWDTFTVPGYWNTKTGRQEGYGWLRLTVENVPSDQVLGLFLEGTFTSYALYVNGEEVLHNGKPGTARENTTAQRIPQLKILPHAPRYEIAWKVANFHYFKGGPSESPFIGRITELQGFMNNINVHNALFLGFYLMIGFFHLLLWAVRRKERVNLLFGLFCLGLIFRYFLPSFGSWTISLVSYELVCKFEYLSLAFSWILFSLYTIELLKAFYMKKFLKYFILIACLEAAFILVTPTWIYTQFLLIYQSILLTYFLWAPVIIFKAIRQKVEGTPLFLGGIGVLFVFLIHDILISNNVFDGSLFGNHIFQYGFAIFLFIQSAIIIFRFATSYTTIERLSEELMGYKADLEKKVKQRTHDLEKAKRKLEALSNQKTNFMINFAHETKTPLTLISNYLESYSKKTTNHDLRVVKKNIDALTRNMVNFLDWEKIEHDQMEYDHTQICHLSEMAAHKVLLFSEIARKKNIAIGSQIEENLFTKADPFALDRVFNNLLDNAIRYTPAGGNIDVIVKAVKTKINCIVRDSGMGIPKRELKNIFKPFYQLSHKKRNIQGIGMGLCIVKKILDALQAKITVQSTVNAGSQFIVTLNQCARKSTAKQLSNNIYSRPFDSVSVLQSSAMRHVSGRTSILIVEDNTDLLNYLVANLSARYNVGKAQNGREALEILPGMDKPAVIISDVMMDQMDGVELYRKISRSEEWNDIPFIFLTVNSSYLEKLQALESGAVDYICKPFSLKELSLKIEALIRINALKKALYEKDKFAALGMLMGGLSHELLNPLNAVYAPLENLESALGKVSVPEKEKVGEYLSRIHGNLKRIEDHVKNLKVLYSQQEIEKERLAMQRIIPAVIDVFQNKLDDKIEITYAVKKNTETWGNHGAFTHILINLVDNAIDALDGRGLIAITAANKNGCSEIRIKDTGKGIKKEDLPYIFNPFYTTKAPGEGCGLGLFIVKNLVLKMGWEIEARSRPERGTEFILTAPRRPNRQGGKSRS